MKKEYGDYRICVKAIILKDNKVILMKRSNYESANANQWDLPGGRLGIAEIPQKALIREVFEETGLNVEIETCFDCQYFTFPKSTTEPEETHNIAISFIARYVSGDMKISEEHVLIDWFDIENIPEDLNLWIKKLIKKAKLLGK
jgi:8-oxo-dGTP diphosphatase